MTTRFERWENRLHDAYYASLDEPDDEPTLTGPEMTALALYTVISIVDEAEPAVASWLNTADAQWLADEIEDVVNDLRRRLAAHEHMFRVRATDIVERLT